MARFLISLCLNGTRTCDHVPLQAVDAQTFSLNGRLLVADNIVDLALPSKVATAMMSSMAAAPDYSYSVFSLLGSRVHHGRYGDAVVHSIIREQTRHYSAPDESQIVFRPPTRRDQGHSGTGTASLHYEECLLFAFDDGAVVCETLHASDATEAVDEVLRMLRIVSLAIFKYPGNKTCVVLVSPHLSTAHMAALFLASRRHVFLYLDEGMSGEEMQETVAEMRQVRDSLCSFSNPLTLDVERAQRLIASDHNGAAPPRVSSTLDALAHTDGEYQVLLAALTQGWAEQQEPRSSPPLHSTATLTRNGDSSCAVLARLRKELEEARAAQRDAEDALADQCSVHRNELLSLRSERESAQRRSDDKTAVSEVLNKSSGKDRSVSHSLLPLYQQQEHVHNYHLKDATSNSVVAQLQKTLQDALKAQRYAEEKVRLLELRQSMTAPQSQLALTTAANVNGVVTSSRPSLRLHPTTLNGVSASSPSATVAPAWEQELLRHENASLVAEFQRKEKEWQQRLRQASAEVERLQGEKSTMEATLLLQSQTIAAAQQALVDSRASQEQALSQTLERVRALSQELRSRSCDETYSSLTGREAPALEARSSSHSLSRPREHQSTHPQHQHSLGSPRLRTRESSGGMMSPNR